MEALGPFVTLSTKEHSKPGVASVPPAPSSESPFPLSDHVPTHACLHGGPEMSGDRKRQDDFQGPRGETLCPQGPLGGGMKLGLLSYLSAHHKSSLEISPSQKKRSQKLEQKPTGHTQSGFLGSFNKLYFTFWAFQFQKPRHSFLLQVCLG